MRGTPHMHCSLRRALTTLAVGAGLLMTSAPPAGAIGVNGSDGSGPTATNAPTSGAASQSVTLITGDVVRVTPAGDGKLMVTVEPGQSSSGHVQSITVGGDVYVIPEEAQAYLAADLLDRDLFNVTTLIEQGYGDEGESLPLIATYAGTAQPRSVQPTPAGTELVRTLPSINGVALSADATTMDVLWDELAPSGSAPATMAAGPSLPHGLQKIWLDGRTYPDLSDSVPQVGAPAAWAAGLDGSGVTVAVLDTGVDATHPDLDDRLVEAISFVPEENSGDRNGHGTHVASTVLGSGEASDGANRGVAPGADLVVGKVLSDQGYGQDSWVISGMEWAAQRADVVNMSLGNFEPSDGADPMSQALNALTAETGTLFVTAAGNNGGEFTIGAPGAADAALTVAAVDGQDLRAEFSSMGPRWGNHALKPDIAAPGVDVTAARSSESAGEGAYTSMNGTSMATPHVAGAAAIVVSQHPDWTAPQIKDALMSSSTALDGTTPYQVGAGRLDIPGALDGVHATGSAFLGFFDWPHSGDEPVSRTITYTNAGDQPVTLSLSSPVTGPGGKPIEAPFALSSATVTVPAGGSSDVAIRADADDLGFVGRYTGLVVATDASGAVAAQTAVGVVKEEERYDLNVSALGRDGQPAGGSFLVLYRYGDAYPNFYPIDPETGQVPTLRLEPGLYGATTWLPVQGDGGPDSAGVALLGTPHLTVDRDIDLVLDARSATKVTATTPKPSEDRSRRIGYFYDAGVGGDWSTMADQLNVSPAVADIFAAPTGQLSGRFDLTTRWRRGAALLDLTAQAGPTSRVRIDPLYQIGSSRLDGEVKLVVVDVGTGAPEAYAGVQVEGKAALAVRSDAVDPTARAEAAHAAGAELLVVVNDKPGQLYEWSGGTDLPVVSLTQAQAEPLLAATGRGRMVLRGQATEFSPFMYDLTDSHEGGIPTDLAYAPKDRELAQVDQRFVSAKPGLAVDARGDCRDVYGPFCFGMSELVEAPSTRSDHVSAQAGTEWFEDALLLPGWEQRGQRNAYQAGDRATRTWFAPLTRPRTGLGFWGPERDGSFFMLNVPTASGGEGITGYVWEPHGSVVSRLYAQGELVDELPFQDVQRTVPVTGGLAEYRFEQETQRPAELWTTSTSTRSAWTFQAEQTQTNSVIRLPLLQLDYHVETDLTGTAARGSKGTIGISAQHQPDAAHAGDVQGATLQVSYDDGATWTDVALRPDGSGGWTSEIRYPRRGAEFVSVKATAWDDAGNSVEQEIIRAYGVR